MHQKGASLCSSVAVASPCSMLAVLVFCSGYQLSICVFLCSHLFEYLVSFPINKSKMKGLFFTVALGAAVAVNASDDGSNNKMKPEGECNVAFWFSHFRSCELFLLCREGHSSVGSRRRCPSFHLLPPRVGSGHSAWSGFGLSPVPAPKAGIC